MDRTIKTIQADNGELYIISAGRRYFAAKFTGYVKITERAPLVPILGTLQKGTKSIYASFVVCDDINYESEQVYGMINSGQVYDAYADIRGNRLEFAGLKFEDSNPQKNELVFQITDLKLIESLLKL
ncbi:MAG: hypothetical protein LUE87_02475 [Lachnospiraceae bacterium]|nr:hypothetical protein [Lachnospiraceae bacterium]